MNEWRNKHPGKILLVLTCLKKGNEERKKKEKSHQRMGWIRKKEKEKEKKKGKKKVDDAGTSSEKCRYRMHGGIEIIYCQSLVLSKYRFSD